jgi:hypothetical protein
MIFPPARPVCIREEIRRSPGAKGYPQSSSLDAQIQTGKAARPLGWMVVSRLKWKEIMVAIPPVSLIQSAAG